MIIHVDMDAFYASIEERERPELCGQPVIVGGTAERRGVVCAANYEARKFGVHSAMASARAVRLCPHAVFLPPRMSLYAEVSHQFHAILERFTPLVEPLALDEAFLDVAGSAALFGSAERIAGEIKRLVVAELQLVASVGVAPNKFLAKIASDLEKPDGLVVVKPAEAISFLDPLPIDRIWGIGRVSREAFFRQGIRTVGQLRGMSEDVAGQLWGELGRHAWTLAQGRDARAVVPDRQAKSVSHEMTFAWDIDDPRTLQACLVELGEQVGHRLRRSDLRARTVQLKIRLQDFRTFTRAATLADPTQITAEILGAATNLFRAFERQRRQPVRLIGVCASGITSCVWHQPGLFDEGEREAQRRLDTTTDAIRQRFGRGAVRRAATWQREDPRRES